MTGAVDPPDSALELVNAALIAKFAGTLGAPRLDVPAAWEARDHADLPASATCAAGKRGGGRGRGFS